MNRLTKLESLDNHSPYHILDMLRIPSSLYSVVTRICEFLVHAKRSELRGQEAVVEVLLHPAMYADPNSPDRNHLRLLTPQMERQLENEAGLSFIYKSRSLRCSIFHSICFVTN